MFREMEAFENMAGRKYKYKTIDISTIAGIKKAEWYQSHGWKIISIGGDKIQFEKKTKRKK